MTRAKPLHASPPDRMTITVSQQVMGFNVRLGSGPQFETALASLKSMIPRRQRQFSRDTWFIHKRAAKRLNQWLAVVRDLGAEVLQKDERGQEISSAA
jgi:hypothetical protein